MKSSDYKRNNEIFDDKLVEYNIRSISNQRVNIMKKNLGHKVNVLFGTCHTATI